MLNRKLMLVIGLFLLTGAACSPTPALAQSVEPLDVSEAIDFQTPTLDSFVLGEHHVASGETLACLGRGYHVLPEAIARFNRMDQAAELQTGQGSKFRRSHGRTCQTVQSAHRSLLQLIGSRKPPSKTSPLYC